MKDAVATMGGLLPDDASGRDAVHVAVFSAFSAVTLRPGEHIAITNQDGRDVEVMPMGDTVAIVDPFLKTVILPGQRFWAYLYPRTITSLSHRWSHPALEETSTIYAPPGTKLASEAWIAKFANDVGLSASVVMEGARNWVLSQERGDYREYLCFGGLLEGCSVPDEFWAHYEVVTSEKVQAEHRGSFFTCSC